VQAIEAFFTPSPLPRYAGRQDRSVHLHSGTLLTAHGGIALEFADGVICAVRRPERR
jgi:hypothetical protein